MEVSVEEWHSVVYAPCSQRVCNPLGVRAGLQIRREHSQLGQRLYFSTGSLTLVSANFMQVLQVDLSALENPHIVGHSAENGPKPLKNPT